MTIEYQATDANNLNQIETTALTREQIENELAIRQQQIIDEKQAIDDKFAARIAELTEMLSVLDAVVALPP